jgi:hypothetical protein
VIGIIDNFSLTHKELLNLNEEELIQILNRNMNKIRDDHDIAVLMGALGVSPKHLSMYQQAALKIRSFQNNKGTFYE